MNALFRFIASYPILSICCVIYTIFLGALVYAFFKCSSMADPTNPLGPTFGKRDWWKNRPLK